MKIIAENHIYPALVCVTTIYSLLSAVQIRSSRAHGEIVSQHTSSQTSMKIKLISRVILCRGLNLTDEKYRVMRTRHCPVALLHQNIVARLRKQVRLISKDHVNNEDHAKRSSGYRFIVFCAVMVFRVLFLRAC